MDYNWVEIFRNKTDLELYKILIGKTVLNSEAKKFAKVELDRRKFNFENIKVYKDKWELERLIKERNLAANYFLRIYHGWRFGLGVLISALVFSIVLFFHITGLFQYENKIGPGLVSNIIFLCIGISFSFFGLIKYRSGRKREKYRENRINELKRKYKTTHNIT